MIKVKLLTEDSKAPTRNTPTDAGLDLYSSETALIRGREWKAISVGISISIPEFGSFIVPKSPAVMGPQVPLVSEPITTASSSYFR